MNYTLKQRKIIQRMGEISARFNAIYAAHQQEQIITGRTMIDAVAALTAVMRQSNELMPLFLQHGDAFREFLDTL
jgi:hypothetical protein